MLIRPDDWERRRATLAPGAYTVHVGRTDGFAAEVLTLAAFVPELLERRSNLEFVASEIDGVWLGSSHLGRVPLSESGGRLSLATSGTAGPQKKFTVDLPGRARTAGLEQDARWLVCYSLGRWASISVIMHAVLARSSLVVPPSLSAAAIIEAAGSGGATHLAITPSLFRSLLVTDPDGLKRAPIRQLTFGGEATSQAVLDAARDLWPSARVTHVFSTTETGDVCSASDGLAGYPWPRMERAGARLLESGELVIDGHATGDLWEVREERAIHLGRIHEIINVGGFKVSPATVEEAAMAQPGVVGAAAYPVRSPILGELVGLDIVGDVDTTTLARSLRSVLPRAACPASIRRVERLILNDAGKLIRMTT